MKLAQTRSLNQNYLYNMITWIDLAKFNADTMTFDFIARCILQNEIIFFEGNSDVISSLSEGILMDGDLVKPESGLAFLKAVQNEYDSPYMQASALQQGDALKPFSSPEWTDVN